MKPKLILFFSLSVNAIFAQTYRAEYRGEMEFLSLNERFEKVGRDSINSQVDTTFIIKVLNKVFRKADFHTQTIVFCNDSIRKIKRSAHSNSPALRVKSPRETYWMFNNQKMEKLSINPKTNEVERRESVVSWKANQILVDKDTLVENKKYRLIKLEAKTDGELKLFFIDPTLPKNMSPTAGGFNPALKVEGGVFKIVRIDDQGNKKMTTTLQHYEIIEGKEIVYPKKQKPKKP